MTIRNLFSTLAVLIFASASSAHAALTLSIDTFNATTLTFTVSGTLDAATQGATYPGVFTLSVDEFVSNQFYNGNPTVDLNTIKIAGATASMIGMASNNGLTGYSAYFYIDPTQPIPAGTTVSGTATFTGTFTSQPTLTLWSGYDSVKNLNRVEAVGTLVPEPTSALLGIVGALAIMRRRR